MELMEYCRSLFPYSSERELYGFARQRFYVIVVYLGGCCECDRACFWCKNLVVIRREPLISSVIAHEMVLYAEMPIFVACAQMDSLPVSHKSCSMKINGVAVSRNRLGTGNDDSLNEFSSLIICLWTIRFKRTAGSGSKHGGDGKRDDV